MQYFDLIPTINYKIKNKEIDIKDLWKEFKLIIESDEDIFFKYKLNGEENFRTLAYKIYDDEEYDWIFYIMNGIYGEYDLPMTEKELYEYCLEKYGSEEEMLKIKYYLTPEIENYYGYIAVPFGILISGDMEEQKPFYIFPDYEDEDTPVYRLVLPTNCIKMTYYDWERKLNDNKKNIKVLKKEYLSLIINLIRNQLVRD